jgi:hypothetical protein
MHGTDEAALLLKKYLHRAKSKHGGHEDEDDTL